MKTDGSDGQVEQLGEQVMAGTGQDGVKVTAYAASLVELAKAEASLDQVDQDLRLAKDTLAGHVNLRGTLMDAALPAEKKGAVIEEIFGGKVSSVTLNFMRLLVGMDKIEALPAVADEFARMLEAEENKVIAEVTTAVPLSKEFTNKLAQRLSKIVGSEITIRPEVDPDIIGGIVVRVGGKLLDGSVSYQLQRLKDQMITEIRSK